MRTRVAITGLGAVSPLGNSVEETWTALLQGRSGIGRITRFDPSALPCRIAGEVRHFGPVPGLSAKAARRLDPFVLYALAACDEAFRQAGLDRSPWRPERAGVVVGTSRGGISTLEANSAAYGTSGYRGLSPFLTVSSLINQAPALICMQYGIHGPSMAVSTACASGAHAMAEALRIIRSGDADLVITGGAEAPVTPLVIGGFSRARALSRRNSAPEEACRPFDTSRDGFVVSEGAGILVLESFEHAKARGAAILGEALGVGLSTDAYHVTAPEPGGAGMAQAIGAALRDAGVGPDEIDLINAHGTGTRLNDRIEALALQKALGAKGSEIHVCAIKSMTGHLLGASGALEAIVSVRSARENRVPPVLNLDRPDPDCPLHFVREEALTVRVDTVLSASFAFGGANAVLVLRSAAAI
jgi:3-oxoacyl-[acyl-carrier-protein] synthase II